jgi:thymidylate synthase
MAQIIEATNIDDLWYKTMTTIMRDGTKISGIQEITNLVLVLRDNFRSSKGFDAAFRTIFGDERIDYASSVTFVLPESSGLMGKTTYKTNDDTKKWTNTYWGRLINWNGDGLNQIEGAIKKLNGGKNTKMISMSVYDPKSDINKVMGGVPCMTAIDIKPRNGLIDITVLLRSMRFSKSGYADVHALCEMGKYIAGKTGTELGSITMVATSGHIFYSGEEATKAKALLKILNNRKTGK